MISFVIATSALEGLGSPLGMVDCDRDPLPALVGDLLGDGLQFFGDQLIEKACILQPATVVALEQVTQDDATRLFIGIQTNELCPLVGGANRAFGQHTADMIGLLRP